MHLLTALNPLLSMKRVFLISLLFVMFNGYAQSSTVEEVADLLNKKKFKAICRQFDKDLAKDLSSKRLQLVWNQTIASFGDYSNCTDVKTLVKDEQIIETAIIHFAKASFTLQLSLRDEKLTGLYIAP